MKILLLTQVLPYPPDSGPKVKTWNVLKYLAQNHEVTLVSFVRGDQQDEVRHLESYCEAVYTVRMSREIWRDAAYLSLSLLTRQPFLMIRDDRAAMRHLIDRLTAEQQFDIVHADQLNMAQYALPVSGARKILDAHNALWVLYKRLWSTMESGPKKWLLGRDWRLLKEYEGRICRDFDGLLAVSEEDKASLQEAAGEPLDITVIPIAIDTDEVTLVNRQAEADHVVHIGTMYWPPNIDGIQWFVREVYSHIRAKRANVNVDVIGARPPKEIVSMGGNGTGINVTGYVKDPGPYLERAGVMVVPLRAGGGMRVKILNALAQGLPIVSTSLGCEGIAVTSGRDILVADTPQEFAKAVLRLLDDPDFARRLGCNGRRLAEEQYDYRRACRPIDAVYNRVTQSKLIQT